MKSHSVEITASLAVTGTTQEVLVQARIKSSELDLTRGDAKRITFATLLSNYIGRGLPVYVGATRLTAANANATIVGGGLTVLV